MAHFFFRSSYSCYLLLIPAWASTFLTLEGFDIKQYDVVCEFLYSTIGFLEWMSCFATQLGPWRLIKAPLPLGIYHIMSIVGSDLGRQKVEVSATAALFAVVCFGAFMYMYHLH